MQFSIIIAVYNGEKYLKRLLDSILSQSIGFEEHIEVVIIDDGSTDSSKSIIDEYKALFPNNIHYALQKNAGQCAARNAGIPLAQGKYLSFINQDDFIDSNYFQTIFAFQERHANKPIEIFWAKQIYFYEKTQKQYDRHPLAGMFNKTARVTRPLKNPEYFQPYTSSAVIKASIIKHHKIKFDVQIIPGSDELDFVSRLLLTIGDIQVAFLKKAVYYKNVKNHKRFYLERAWHADKRPYDNLYFAAEEIIKAAEKNIILPSVIHNLFLFELGSYIKWYSSHNNVDAYLTNALQDIHTQKIATALKYITNPDIENFPYEKIFGQAEKDIAIFLLKKEKTTPHKVIVRNFDSKRNLLNVYTYGRKDTYCSMRCNEELLAPAFSKKIPHSFKEETRFTHYLSFSCREGDNVKFYVDGEKAVVVHRKQFFSHLALTEETITSQIKNKKLSIKTRLKRAFATHPVVKKLYSDAWLLMDSDTRADDNAEHFYRWVKKNYPKQKIFFVLRKNSPDWARLKQEKFNLVEYNSTKFRLIFLHCSWIISSHFSRYIFKPFVTTNFRDIIKWQFCLIEHGITINDISTLVNQWKIDLFATVGKQECNNIIEDSKYKFSEKEVHITGLPRHDSLLEKATAAKPCYILLTPTWRDYLVGAYAGSFDRSWNPEFEKSNFCKNWQYILTSDILLQSLKKHGLELLFYPHPHLAQYYNLITGNSDMETKFKTLSYQDALVHSKLAVTDYSSVGTEFAILRRPLIYYQFDKEKFFKNHSYKEGNFQYDAHGFGEIASTADELITCITTYVENGCSMKEEYLSRVNNFFAFNDQNNCQRVYDSIIEVSKPHLPVTR